MGTSTDDGNQAPTPQFRYKAFLSYSRHDDKIGRWLHRALEAYRVPKDLVGSIGSRGPIASRVTPIFRDRDELSVADDLPQILHDALADSEFLIVLCTPNAAKSDWVNKEIAYFKKVREQQRIIAVIGAGRPGASLADAADDECFPAALLSELTPADGERRYATPLAADLRKEGDGREDCVLKVAAGLLGVNFDKLKRREEIAKRRRLQWWISGVSAAAIAMAAVAGFAILQMKEAERQRLLVAAERDRATKALTAAHAAASGLTQELAVGTRNWPGVDKAYINRMLIRAQNILLVALTAGGEDVSSIQRSLAIVYSSMSDIQGDVGNLTLAETLAREALRMFQMVHDKRHDPDDVSHDIAIMHRKIGTVEERAGNGAKAVEALREGLSFSEAAFERTKSSSSWLFEVAMTRAALGRALGRFGEAESAIALMKQADADFEVLSPLSPQSQDQSKSSDRTAVDKYRGQNNFLLAQLLLQRDRDAALEQFLNAKTLLSRYSNTTRDEVEVIQMEGVVLQKIGAVYLLKGETDNALQFLSQAVFVTKNLISMDGRRRSSVDVLAISYQLSASAWVAKNEKKLAVALLDRAREERQWLIDKFPNDADVHVDMADLVLLSALLTDDPKPDAKSALSHVSRFRQDDRLAPRIDNIIKSAEAILRGSKP